jgi:hypothetical protein
MYFKFKSSTWNGCLYFSGFILEFNSAILSLIDDVPVDNEAPVATLSILRFVDPTRFFRDAHKGRVCVGEERGGEGEPRGISQ